MSDLNNSVIMPRQDFLELSEAAWNQPTPAIKDRVASTAQTTIFCAAVAAAITAGTWGWAKAVDWREERALERAMKLREFERNLQK